MNSSDYTIWSEEPKDFAHNALLTTVKAIKSNQSGSQQDLQDYIRYYTGKRLHETLSQASRMTERMYGSWNLCFAVTDTLVNRIGKNRPMPRFYPSGGDHTIRTQSKQLSKFIVGQFYAMGLYKIAPEVCRDALIHGTGAVKFSIEDNKLRCERVNRLELFVDETEGYYGTPRNLYHTKAVPRATLLAKYPRLKNEINAAPNTTNPLLPINRHADYVDVTEGWCLPSAPGKKDGRWVQALDGATLQDEKWINDWFPFVFFNWSQPLFGFWGQGVVEQVYPFYYNVNWINDRIQKCQKLLGIPYIFIEQNSDVPNDRMAPNQVAKIIQFRNTHPQVYVPQNVVPPELYQERNTQWTKGFELVGLSELSATSRKPAGVTAAVAIRTLNDLETARFIEYGMRWENFFVDIAKLLIKMVKNIAEESGDYSVPLEGNKFLNEIKWSKVALEENQYTIQPFPTSLLPIEPAGKMSTVQEMIQSGMIPEMVAKEMLNIPDIERWNDLEEAGRDYIRQSVEQITEEGIMPDLDPFDDLQYAIEYTRQVYSQMKLLPNTPDQVFQMLRDFMAQASDLLDAANPPPPPGPPPGGAPGQPIAAPAAPPTSDLLPFPTVKKPPA